MALAQPSRFVRYAAAIAATAGAIVVKEALGPGIVPSAYLTFYAGVLVTALYGGFGPACLAILLSAPLGWALYLAPESAAGPLAPLVVGRVALFVVVALAICWVVHKRRLSRADLAEREARLRRLVESDMVGVIFWDRAGGISAANDHFLRMIGYTRADLEAGRVRWTELTPPEYAHLDAAGLAEIDATGACAPFEKEYVHRDGSRVAIVIGGAAITPERDRGVSFVLDNSARKRAEEELRRAKAELERRVADRTAELELANERLQAELTERLRAEEGLRLSEERYALAAAGANDGVWDWDIEANRVYLSDRWREILGLTADEVGDDPQFWVGRVHADDRDMVAAAVGAHLDGMTPNLRAEYRLRHANGTYRWVLARGVAVRDENGRPYRMAGSLTDLTARRRAEDEVRRRDAQLAHAQRLSTVGEMAASIAHELNQPLTAIANYANGCEWRLSGGDVAAAELGHAVRQIAGQALRAGEILRRYRGFVRADSSRYEPVNLNALAQEVARFSKGTADEAEVVLRLDLAPEVPDVVADGVQIEQVLVNLIRNGIEAMNGAERREIWVRTRCDGRQIEVAVEDAGHGVPEESRERIFEAFYTTKSDGLGMGLSISSSIIEGHGGRIWLAANGRGGATFAFSLPVETPAEVVEARRRAREMD